MYMRWQGYIWLYMLEYQFFITFQEDTLAVVQEIESTSKINVVKSVKFVLLTFHWIWRHEWTVIR